MIPIIHFRVLNELPNFGEWTAIIEEGDSTIDQVEDASYPHRGKLGLRISIANYGEDAYALKDISDIDLRPGGSIYIGMFIRMPSYPSSDEILCSITAQSTYVAGYLHLDANGRIRGEMRKDDGDFVYTNYSSPLATDIWHYISWAIRRASSPTSADGQTTLFINGAEVASSSEADNYDRFSTLDRLLVGSITDSRAGFVCDFDEISLADRMVRPFIRGGRWLR